MVSEQVVSRVKVQWATRAHVSLTCCPRIGLKIGHTCGGMLRVDEFVPHWEGTSLSKDLYDLKLLFILPINFIYGCLTL
ncbi:hypothetical protein DVH24_028196 [Malus domestica]|uniref:Uncharacterized protein n=1 Tax=Malus domestica TaxID=3750 RepID=A0A498HAL1_MALDO|nr:hypothetical protein DVH24_028196 [Malus domestica]